MGFPKFQLLDFVYEYDFAVDGGGVGSKSLRAIGNAMTSDLVIEDAEIFVETAFDDAGDTATVTLGNSVDDDGYMVDFMTLAETVNTPIRVGEQAGALMYDDANDHLISYKIPSSAASVPKIKIGTEALTQGKAKFVFRCRRY